MGQPKRILHIVSSMNRGGIENAIMNYYRHIDRDRIQFDFLLEKQAKGEFEDEIIALGGRIYKNSLNNPLKYIWNLNKFLKQHKEYSIIHAHHLPWAAIPLAFSKFHGINHRICHIHFASNPVTHKQVKSILHKIVPKFSTHYFSCGEYAGKRYYGDKIIKSGAYRIIPNSINIDRYAYNESVRKEYRRKLQIADDELIIGQVGRISFIKNHKFALEVIKEMVNLGHKIKFLIVGDGEMSAEIKQYAGQLGVSDYCLFVGSVANPEDYMQAMDALIFPSFKEGLGMVAIEAQTAGLKCFVSDGVPQEVKRTDLVTFLPLSQGTKYWAESILKGMPYTRISHAEEIVAAGFEIEEATKQLQDFYLNLK